MAAHVLYGGLCFLWRPMISMGFCRTSWEIRGQYGLLDSVSCTSLYPSVLIKISQAGLLQLSYSYFSQTFALGVIGVVIVIIVIILVMVVIVIIVIVVIIVNAGTMVIIVIIQSLN